MKNKIIRSLSFLIISTFICGSLPINNTLALTYSSVSDVEFTFNSVISVSLSSPNLVISDLAPGEASDSNIVTVGATTNGSAGYQLSATVGVKNGTDALVNTTNSSNTFVNLTATKANLAGFSDNIWGYSYCADTSANCNGGSGAWVSGSKGSTIAGYAGLPLDNNTNASDRDLGGVLLLNTSGPEDTVQSIQFKIGAKASNNQASGDYTNTINFYAVANPEPQLGPVGCTAGKICYNENALSGVEGTMGQQDATDGNTVTLLASNFSRNNYGFAGWNTAYDYSGTFYGPNEDMTVPNGTTANGYSLFAVWIKSAGSMQSDATSVCNSLSQANPSGGNDLSNVSALTDQRDNQTYAIAKLADGKCWMIENLRLESTNSDNSTGALAQGYGASATYGNFSGLADAESTGFSSTYSANSLYSNDGSNGTININSSDSPAYRMPRYNNLNTQSRASNPTNNIFPSNNTAGGMYSYGNYYTWHAAIADLTYNETNHNTVSNTSLCPAGWRLPTGGQSNVNTTGNYYVLTKVLMNGMEPNTNAQNGNGYYSGTVNGENIGDKASKAIRAFPNNILYSGCMYEGTLCDRGEFGYYWTATPATNNVAYALNVSGPSSYVTPGTIGIAKYVGRSIRCIRQP